MGIKTKLNARLAIPQRGDLFQANISANKISLLQGHSLLYFVFLRSFEVKNITFSNQVWAFRHSSMQKSSYSSTATPRAPRDPVGIWQHGGMRSKGFTNAG